MEVFTDDTKGRLAGFGPNKLFGDYDEALGLALVRDFTSMIAPRTDRPR